MAAQRIVWFVWIQLFLNTSDAIMSGGRKLTTSDDATHHPVYDTSNLFVSMIKLIIHINYCTWTNFAHTDFINIDCGASSGYPDPQTGISYQTNIGFVETGTNFMVATESRLDIDFPLFGRQLQTLRSFPEGKRNCYTLKLKQAAKNNNYLVRAFFAYGNYDAKNRSQTFDLYLNVDFWKTVHFNDETSGYEFAEIIHTPTTDTILVCLVNTGRGIPFISSLELRPLGNSIYLTRSPSQSFLVLDTRVDVGSIQSTSSLFKRFKDDIYDRVWRVDSIFKDEG
ncbi:probable LRR receptor-like serine/threonine-protein kinase At4g29180 [Neltuma alba]|uniref:probable LRR receptor-like serine/threonine-protein kinase At4g29180 n=1 Tax=Neltuma alba TaxID=207710 RepID=UPI0010A33E8F|nr:probable LRR receptor-like serine/threonine-protein kinase At4g29180 [Prosopis alba]